MIFFYLFRFCYLCKQRFNPLFLTPWDNFIVGTFSRENKTLYIGNIKNTQDMKEIVLRHFEEFGEIEKYNVLNNRCIAFVTYKSRLNAEFAREAMMGQSLDNDEVSGYLFFFTY